MARALTDWNDDSMMMPILGPKEDIERLSPRAMKHYLEYRLRIVEMQIEILADRLGADTTRSARTPWMFAHEPLDEQRRELWSSIRYLEARRDALRNTLSTL